MGGRHKNFEDPMPYELRKRINKFRNVTFFMGHPLCFSLVEFPLLVFDFISFES